MRKFRLAVAIAAAFATSVVVGPAFAGVHVMTISQQPLVIIPPGGGGIPATGFDAVELLVNPGQEGEGGSGGGDPNCSKRSLADNGNHGRHVEWTNRSESNDWRKRRCGGTASMPFAQGSSVSGAPADLNTWHGLDHWDSRFGSGPNAFSGEPPDQGLCVGDGQVLEIVNSAVRSFTPTGTPTSPVRSNTQFFGYPDAINRETGELGPQVTDPSCIFDPRVHEFFTIALTYFLNQGSGQPSGKNVLDIAVSTSANPTVAIQRYSIPVRNDGTGVTPSHPNCPCVGDFPQLGMDQYGFYITTNEYPWFSDGFNGAQLYAMSRAQLEAGASFLKVVHLDQLKAAGNPAFTMWPARSNEGDYNVSNGGTENFLSSMAAPEANNETGIDNRIAVWSLRHTSSLDTPFAGAALRLHRDVVRTESYAIPPPSEQKPINPNRLPLMDCLNHDDCAAFLNNDGNPATDDTDPFKPEVEGPLDSSDSRILTNWYVNGTLFGALDTALKVQGDTKAGIAWFAFDAQTSRVLSQDYLAVANNNVIYPAVATLTNGAGAMAFTLAGTDYFPSAAYASVNVGGDSTQSGARSSGAAVVGNPTFAFPGVGPQDGFTEYKYYSPTGDGVPRPRWGDYGAAVSDGTSVWLASEYIGQTCTYPEYLSTAFQCGQTRTALANWGTRVTQINP